MRTDNVILSDDALSETRSIIGATYGDAFLSEQPRRHTKVEERQEAHEAIRPTTLCGAPERS